MATIERMPLPRYGPQPSFGTTAPITPAITTPTKRAAPMSRGRITKPYSRMRRTTFRLPRSAQHGSVQGGGPPCRTVLLRFAPQPYQHPAQQTGDKGHDRAENGDHRPQQGVGDGDAVDSGLRRREQERRGGGPAGPVAAARRPSRGLRRRSKAPAARRTGLAFNTGRKPPPPRCRSTNSGEMHTESRPAARKPNNRYGAIWPSTCQLSHATLTTISIADMFSRVERNSFRSLHSIVGTE